MRTKKALGAVLILGGIATSCYEIIKNYKIKKDLDELNERINSEEFDEFMASEAIIKDVEEDEMEEVEMEEVEKTKDELKDVEEDEIEEDEDNEEE